MPLGLGTHRASRYYSSQVKGAYGRSTEQGISVNVVDTTVTKSSSSSFED